MGLGFSHLGEAEAGRRRQSSNFFDILTDPQRYQEQVHNFVSETFQEDDHEEVKEIHN